MHIFYCFFSNKLVVWMYNFVLVMVCFRFCEIVFVCKLLKLVVWITELDVLWWERCCFMLKKKNRTMLFWATLFLLLLPLDVQQGKIEICVSHLFLPRMHTPPHNEKPTKSSLQTTPIGHLVRRRLCKPHPLATSFGVVAGQEGPSPHVQR